jgi:hypothetical protein
MISIADLLKQQSKPQKEEKKPKEEEIIPKVIKFDEDSIQELMHVNNFKKKDPSYNFNSDPKTPFEDELDDEEIDPLAKENMLKN